MGLISDNTKNNNDDLMLYRKYVQQQKKLGVSEIVDNVLTIQLSSTEEWILIKTKEALALINAESKLGKTLWNEFKKFNGEGGELLIIPDKGKIGFDLIFGVKKVYYIWEDEVLHISKTKKLQGLESSNMKGLTWTNCVQAIKKTSVDGSTTTSTTNETSS